ncbi:MAG: hypothetical protein SCABRO_01680 [Candidatus Scalindua brodae]|uniref:site-specific DNA-methyltransferase (adenine-specific) n=1 Tax=Candidatus Scalindua brodae TaxID=237368 RepID=A0A0B0EPJ1_9BACT|nr:MAG: hypothetical protein SCABRO_01680 [Candidatus Scalindua brodae]
MWSDKKAIDFELIHDDAVHFLRNYEYTGKELVYCDPPYLRETRKKYARIYKYEYSREQHIKLLEVIKSLPCMVMISGYESTLYKESLRSWQTHCFQAVCHHGVATEWLWMNYNVPVGLHDYRYLGSNFRERERIKRKTKRWTAKLQSMPILERQALLSAIDVVREQ